MNTSKENCTTTPCAEVWMEDDIMFVEYLPIIATMEQAKEHIKILKNKYADKMPVLSFSDISKIKQSKKEVRNYLASDEVASLVIASALITGSGLSKIVGNLFLKFSSPK